ncbi:hypothetical protein [Nocardia sp. bgisy134]|uniref:hypothetical protein n=1 Tax=Nocardia sp. bgisy134 TaxID=3413789 RepID=UPI003D72D2A8
MSADDAVTRDDLAGLVDLLVAGGDLLELRHNVDSSVRLLYLGPPSYIEREPGTYLLLGIRPFGAPLVDKELGDAIEQDAHLRSIRLDPETAAERMSAAGLQLIDREQWVASPRREDAQALLHRLRKHLDAARPSGEISELRVLDPRTPVRYYRGRWRPPKPGDTGDFVARRPQAYGADLWCLVRLEAGSLQKLVEFPIDNPTTPGRDEAWRTQMAMDAVRGVPQFYRKAPAVGSATAVEFFSPIPGFTERYLQLVSLPLVEPSGALFSFRIPSGAMPALERLLSDMLWMDAVKEGPQ